MQLKCNSKRPHGVTALPFKNVDGVDGLQTGAGKEPLCAGGIGLGAVWLGYEAQNTLIKRAGKAGGKDRALAGGILHKNKCAAFHGRSDKGAVKTPVFHKFWWRQHKGASVFHS